MSTPIHIEIQPPLTCSVSLLIRRPRTRELCLTAYITISTPILPRKHIFKREIAPNKKTAFLWVSVNPTNTWTSYGHTPSRRWRLGDRKRCPQRRNFICDDITSEPGFAVIESCICLDGLYVLSVCVREWEEGTEANRTMIAAQRPQKPSVALYKACEPPHRPSAFAPSPPPPRYLIELKFVQKCFPRTSEFLFV